MSERIAGEDRTLHLRGKTDEERIRPLLFPLPVEVGEDDGRRVVERAGCDQDVQILARSSGETSGRTFGIALTR